MQSMSLPPGKRLPGKVLSNSYLFLYLTFKLAPFDADARRDFLAAKLEATRFHQWAGEFSYSGKQQAHALVHSIVAIQLHDSSGCFILPHS